MTNTEAPKGVLCSMPTPFNASGSIDLTALGELAEVLERMPVQGIFILGTAGEAMLLSAKEREDALERVLSSISDAGKTILHCGMADTPGTVRLAKHARACGVASMAAIAPYYYRYASCEVEDHYRTLAESVPDAAIYVYDNPGRVGYQVGAATVAQLTKTVENVVGVKDTGDSLGRITRYIAADADIQIYVGSNDLVLSGLEVGCRGAVSALAGALPELVGSVYLEWLSGRNGRALEHQLDIARVMTLLDGLPYLGALKWLARSRGLPVGRMRSPQPELDEIEGARLLDSLRKSGLESWLSPIENHRQAQDQPSTP